MSFAPTSTDGGVINIGNSVGVGNANFDGHSSASGASSNLGFNLNLGGATQPTLMLVNLESYDEFMPAWLTDAQNKMKDADANGQKANPDGSVTTTTSSSSSSSSLMNLGTYATSSPRSPYSLMNLKETYKTTFKRSGGKVIGTYKDANGKTQTFTIPESQLTRKGLMNLADSHMGNFDSYGFVEFQGGGAGMHTIDNMRGNAGSHTVFSI